MDVPKVDWSTADVSGETLSVDIAGEQGDGFAEGFALAGRLLAADTPFGAVTLDGATVTVEHVRPGSEEQVRFLVEGAVLQANADAQRERAEGETGETDETNGADDDGPSATDSRMTERLRGFAEAEDDSGAAADPGPTGEDSAGGG